MDKRLFFLLFITAIAAASPAYSACYDTDSSPDYTKLDSLSYPITKERNPDLFVRGRGKGIYFGTHPDHQVIYGEMPNPSHAKPTDDPYSTYYDYCATDFQLNEANCYDDGTLGSTGITCPYGCEEGACIRGYEEDVKDNSEVNCRTLGAVMVMDNNGTGHIGCDVEVDGPIILERSFCIGESTNKKAILVPDAYGRKDRYFSTLWGLPMEETVRVFVTAEDGTFIECLPALNEKGDEMASIGGERIIAKTNDSVRLTFVVSNNTQVKPSQPPVQEESGADAPDETKAMIVDTKPAEERSFLEWLKEDIKNDIEIIKWLLSVLS